MASKYNVSEVSSIYMAATLGKQITKYLTYNGDSDLFNIAAAIPATEGVRKCYQVQGSGK